MISAVFNHCFPLLSAPSLCNIQSSDARLTKTNGFLTFTQETIDSMKLVVFNFLSTQIAMHWLSPPPSSSPPSPPLPYTSVPEEKQIALNGIATLCMRCYEVQQKNTRRLKKCFSCCNKTVE